jgi:hypothetical protein
MIEILIHVENLVVASLAILFSVKAIASLTTKLAFQKLAHISS